MSSTENGNGRRAMWRALAVTAIGALVATAVVSVFAWARSADQAIVLHESRIDALDAAQTRDRRSTAEGLRGIQSTLERMDGRLQDIGDRLARQEGRDRR